MAGSLLEDNEVHREELAQLPHHGEFGEQGPVVNKPRDDDDDDDDTFYLYLQKQK